jgi:hemolysin activation/secretion protein
MRLMTKSICLIIVVMLLFSPTAFTGITRAENTNTDSGIEKLLREIGGTLASLIRLKKENGVAQARRIYKAELAELEETTRARLQSVERKAETDVEAIAQEKKRVEEEYRSEIGGINTKYRKSWEEIEERSKQAGIYGLGLLFADKEKAAVIKLITQDKARIKAEYKKARAVAAADCRTARLDLKSRQKSLAKSRSEEEAQIKADHREALAKLRLKRRYAEAKAEHKQWALPEDTTLRFSVKQLHISGNNLISTAELLERLPLVYTGATQKGRTTIEETYDFRVLYEIILDPGPEREVSKKTIAGLTQYILSVYQKKGYAGIYVYVPAKAVKGVAELEDGILPIKVLEGKVVEVVVNRYDFDRQEVKEEILKSSILEEWSPAKQGQVIRKNQLDDFVRLLNSNPDRYISTIVSRSKEPNALDLTYDVYEGSPWHWYAQIDDSGTDKRQWTPRVGVVNTNLTGRDDKFSFMYRARPDSIQDNHALFGNYECPLFTPKLRLGFYAGYSEFELTPETGADINFRGNGSFYGGTLRYNVFQINDWMIDFLGSLSQETSKVTPSLGLRTDVDMDLVGVGCHVHRSDNISDTSILFNRIENFGGSGEDEFMKARIDSDPDFTIYTLWAAHKQFLDKAKIHELSASFRSVMPTRRLIAAKMTTFGGLYSVRGYKEDEIVADGGIITSAQYRFDLTEYVKHKYAPMSSCQKTGAAAGKEEQSDVAQGQEAWPPSVSLLAFTDYGRAKMKDPIPGEEETQDLWGAGLGAVVEIGGNAYGAIYYSWPLRSTDDSSEGKGQWNFSFMYRW